MRHRPNAQIIRSTITAPASRDIRRKANGGVVLVEPNEPLALLGYLFIAP